MIITLKMNPNIHVFSVLTTFSPADSFYLFFFWCKQRISASADIHRYILDKKSAVIFLSVWLKAVITQAALSPLEMTSRLSTAH